MITVHKGISAAKEIRDQYVSAKSDPVAWNQSLALEAALTALASQGQQIAQLETAIQQLAAQIHRR